MADDKQRPVKTVGIIFEKSSQRKRTENRRSPFRTLDWQPVIDLRIDWTVTGDTTGTRLVRSPAQPIFFLRTDDSHCDRIHSFSIAVRCLDNGYVGR